jgi:membrane-associated phospholipid phosphatase
MVLVFGSVGLTVGAVPFDQSVRDQSFKWQSSRASDFFSAMNNGGEIVYAGAFAGGLYAGGLFAGVPELRRTGRLLLEAYLVSGVTATLIKFTAGRARPYTNLGYGDLKWFQTNDDFLSFPSGHTTVAFATATVLGGVIDRWWAYVPLYSAACLVGTTRIYKDMHWLSDVVLGASVGTLSGLLVLGADKQNSPDSKVSGAQFHVYPSLNGIGLAVSF